jgi:hypothetical protein
MSEAEAGYGAVSLVECEKEHVASWYCFNDVTLGNCKSVLVPHSVVIPSWLLGGLIFLGLLFRASRIWQVDIRIALI